MSPGALFKIISWIFQLTLKERVCWYKTHLYNHWYWTKLYLRSRVITGANVYCYIYVIYRIRIYVLTESRRYICILQHPNWILILEFNVIVGQTWFWLIHDHLPFTCTFLQAIPYLIFLSSDFVLPYVTASLPHTHRRKHFLLQSVQSRPEQRTWQIGSWSGHLWGHLHSHSGPYAHPQYV